MDMQLEKLQADFGSGQLTFRRGDGGLIFLRVGNALGEAEICLYGAQVLAFAPRGEAPVLWLSRQSCFAPGKAIRGGVPICWPWFGAHPGGAGKPAHGFARVAEWQLDAVSTLGSGATRLVFRLDPSMVPAGLCEQDFELEYCVTVGRELTLELTMTNCDVKVMEVSAALHSYFAVSDIDAIEITGLGGAEVIDTVTGKIGRETEVIRIAGETDRIYCGTDAEVTISDPGAGRKIKIERLGSHSAVVWNPWVEKSRRLPDFGDEEYRTMVCVEAGMVRSDAKRLSPGENWILGCRIGVVKS